MSMKETIDEAMKTMENPVMHATIQTNSPIAENFSLTGGGLLHWLLVRLLGYGALVTIHNQQFDQKWIQKGQSPDDVNLGHPDQSSLIDLGSSFTVIRNMGIIPIDRNTLVSSGKSCGNTHGSNRCVQYACRRPDHLGYKDARLSLEGNDPDKIGITACSRHGQWRNSPGKRKGRESSKPALAFPKGQ